MSTTGYFTERNKPFAPLPSAFSVLILVCILPAGRLAAAVPRVVFDLAPTVECRDVTPEDFAADRPDQKVIEATFSISVRMIEGGESDLHEMLLEVVNRGRRMQIHDFAPRRTLESDLEGSIEVVHTSEVSRSAGVDVQGTLALPLGTAQANVKPDARLGTSHRDVMTEKLQKKPPRQAIIVSGTSGGGHGVFFKWKPSPQQSLEGMHEVTCSFRVPRAWKADWLDVTCRARAKSNTYFGTEIKEVGSARVAVGAYLLGDEAGRAAALKLAAAQGYRQMQAVEHTQPRTDPLALAFTDLREHTRDSLARIGRHLGLPSPVALRGPVPGNSAEESEHASQADRLHAAQQEILELSGVSP